MRLCVRSPANKPILVKVAAIASVLNALSLLEGDAVADGFGNTINSGNVGCTNSKSCCRKLRRYAGLEISRSAGKDAPNMPWFSGKTVFIIQCDESGDKMIEERVVLLSCETSDEALQRLEQLSKEYAAEGQWLNAAGQHVRTVCINAFDVFALNSELSDGAEVYSRMEVVSPSTDVDDQVVRFFGAEPTDAEETIRSRLEPDFERAAEKESRDLRAHAAED